MPLVPMLVRQSRPQHLSDPFHDFSVEHLHEILETHDDEFEWHDLGVVTGKQSLSWTVPDFGAARVVSSLRFRADFSGSDRSLTITLTPKVTVAEATP